MNLVNPLPRPATWAPPGETTWRRPRLQVDTTTRPDVERRTALLPPYAVILHNDDVNDMLYVVQSLHACVPDLTLPRCVQIMLEAHQTGRARVIVCPLELAELYRERLQGRGLTATIERA